MELVKLLAARSISGKMQMAWLGVATCPRFRTFRPVTLLLETH